MPNGSLSGALMAAHDLLQLYHPDHPIDQEAREQLLSTLKSCSGLAEQFERLARARAATLTSDHLEQNNIIQFPDVSRGFELHTKGIENDT